MTQSPWLFFCCYVISFCYPDFQEIQSVQHNHPESSWLHVKTIKIVGHCDTALKTVYAKTYNQNSQLKAFFSYIQIQNDVMDTLKLTTTYLSIDESV